MKVVILSHEPYRSFMRKHYFMDELSHDGYETEYWCIQEALRYSAGVEYKIKESGSNVIYINSQAALIDRLNKLHADTYVCLEIFFVWDTLNIFKALTKKGLRLFSIDYFKNYPDSRTKLQRVVRSVQELNLKTFLRYANIFLSRSAFALTTKLMHIHGVSKVFIPGQRSSMFGNNVVPINHFDFYKFRAAKQDPYSTTEPYIVFLDDCLPNHPDLARHNRQTLKPEIYYKKLNSFFDLIESSTGCRVIIAAHPKATYGDEFNSRACVFNQTAELVVSAESIISHHSTSLNFAILAYKPIWLIYTNEFVDKNNPVLALDDIYDILVEYKKLLNCKLINIDDSQAFNGENPVDRHMYNKFINDFIVAADSDHNNYKLLKKGLDLEKSNANR